MNLDTCVLLKVRYEDFTVSLANKRPELEASQLSIAYKLKKDVNNEPGFVHGLK